VDPAEDICNASNGKEFVVAGQGLDPPDRRGYHGLGGIRLTPCNPQEFRQLVARRAAGLEAAARWEAAQAAEAYRPAVFVSIGALWDLLPIDVRTRDDDPTKTGIRRMHAALGVLGRGSA